MDYANLSTPAVCIADFCLIPIGTPTASVSNEVAAVQRLMKASGLSYSMHSAGTTVEGPWDEVMRIIGQAHTLVHQNGVLRIQSDIRVGTRTDKKQHFSEKVTKVEGILAADSKSVVEQKVLVNDDKGAKPESKDHPEPAKEAEKKTKTVESKQQPLSPSTNKGTWASMLKK